MSEAADQSSQCNTNIYVACQNIYRPACDLIMPGRLVPDDEQEAVSETYEYIYIYVCVCVFVCVYIYIYI